MGNAQQVADGSVVVGWGTYPGFSEIGPDGTLRFDARFAGTSVTYRAHRQPWVGRPATRPALASVTSSSGSTVVYASWNGATEVTRWQVRVGSSASDLRSARNVARRGFETAVGLVKPGLRRGRCRRPPRRAARHIASGASLTAATPRQAAP